MPVKVYITWLFPFSFFFFFFTIHLQYLIYSPLCSLPSSQTGQAYSELKIFALITSAWNTHTPDRSGTHEREFFWRMFLFFPLPVPAWCQISWDKGNQRRQRALSAWLLFLPKFFKHITEVYSSCQSSFIHMAHPKCGGCWGQYCIQLWQRSPILNYFFTYCQCYNSLVTSLVSLLLFLVSPGSSPYESQRSF